MNVQREVLTISALNRAVKRLLEENFGLVWVEGEISNLARPNSGHIYFSLKDADAQVRCAMFRAKNRLLNFDLENGAQVMARARVGMYEARGEYQLIVEHMEPAGEGLLRLKFEQLKRKLAAEGLFDEEQKLELPLYPQSIGIITSETGAALRDILNVLKRRNPSLSIVIYPCAVQGIAAPAEIVNALDVANQRDECDVLILARGGGSLEDLWAFNDENVARAIFASEIPIISGIGHEIDFTIADFVADVRAPTPSASAEICAPKRSDIENDVTYLARQLSQLIGKQVADYMRDVVNLSKRLQHPGRRIEQLSQRCDELSQRLPQALLSTIAIKNSHITALNAQLKSLNPGHRVRQYETSVSLLQQRLQQLMSTQLHAQQSRVGTLERALRAVSPDATLERGYAILTDNSDAIVREARSVSKGDHVTARLAKGGLKLKVERIKD